MTGIRRPITLLATVALILAACGGGGGGAATTAPDGGTATSAPTDAAAPAAPAPADATPAASEPSSGGSGSGGTAVGVCELVTAEELAAIFNVPLVTTMVFIGPPDTCSVISDTGDPLVAWSYSAAQSKAVYDAFTTDPSTVPVNGIGDKAAFVQNTGLLVLKGDALSVISVQSGDEEIAKEVAAAAAGRM